MLHGWLSVISMGKGNKNSLGFSYRALFEGYRDVNIDDSLDGTSHGFFKSSNDVKPGDLRDRTPHIFSDRTALDSWIGYSVVSYEGSKYGNLDGSAELNII